jgi:hypothetical protein
VESDSELWIHILRPSMQRKRISRYFS